MEMLIRQQSDSFCRREDQDQRDCCRRCWQNYSQFLRSSFYWSKAGSEGQRFRAWSWAQRIVCFYSSRSFLFRYSYSYSSRMRTNYDDGGYCCRAEFLSSLWIDVIVCYVRWLSTIFTGYALTSSYLFVSAILSFCTVFPSFSAFLFLYSRNRMTIKATTLATTDRCTNSTPIFPLLLTIPIISIQPLSILNNHHTIFTLDCSSTNLWYSSQLITLALSLATSLAPFRLQKIMNLTPWQGKMSAGRRVSTPLMVLKLWRLRMRPILLQDWQVRQAISPPKPTQKNIISQALRTNFMYYFLPHSLSRMQSRLSGGLGSLRCRYFWQPLTQGCD